MLCLLSLGADMRRRELITLLGGATAAWPLAARAQQAERMRRMGVLMNVGEASAVGERALALFKQALERLGWSDGRNIQLTVRWAAGDPALSVGVSLRMYRLGSAPMFQIYP